jgi:hypothetical protein
MFIIRFLCLLLLFFSKNLSLAQDIEENFTNSQSKVSFIQTFGLHNVPEEDNLFPHEFFSHTRLLLELNESFSYGLNSVFIYTFGSEARPMQFFHIGLISQYHFIRKRRIDNNKIYYLTYLEGGLNIGNFYFTIDNGGFQLPLKKYALQVNLGIGAKQYLNKVLFIDYGVGFMSILYKRIPEAHNAFGFYRIGIGRDLILHKKEKKSSYRNVRNL